MSTAHAALPAPGVTTIVVGDGMRSNALAEDGWHRLTELLRSATDDPLTHAIVLTGYGDTFTAGSDLTEWEDAEQSSVERCFAAMEDCFHLIEHADVPVIAAIEGTALGAGCQLALACDLAVMGESAHLGMPIARLGILASPAFVARVSAKAGSAIAADLYLTGRSLQATEAHACGLVARVVPDGTAYETARRLAERVGAFPSASVGAAKQALLAVSRRDVDTPELRRVPSVAISEFRSAVTAFVHRHDRAKAS